MIDAVVVSKSNKPEKNFGTSTRDSNPWPLYLSETSLTVMPRDNFEMSEKVKVSNN